MNNLSLSVKELQRITSTLSGVVHDVLEQTITIVSNELDTEINYDLQTGVFTGSFGDDYHVSIGRDLNNFSVFVNVTKGDKTGIFEVITNVEGGFSAKRAPIDDNDLMRKFGSIISELCMIDPRDNNTPKETTEVEPEIVSEG